ncbi:3-oxoacyl-ACP synthase [Sulfitobacter sp. HNIBRBA3233]|uniref:3-oxoacyl-ACP synthase n=1 Tax=Sulfitobacter marinivivus TaxID=3158558 RepID=UPI0032DF8CA4
MSTGVNIIGCGMVTAVGLNAAATTAAMRAGLDGFQETQFMSAGGEWLIGAPVPLPRDWVGEKRLAHLAAGALLDALDGHAQAAGDLQIVLCLAEEGRPGRPVRDDTRFAQRMLEFAGLPSRTKVHSVRHGRPSGIVALERIRRMFARGEAGHAVVLGVDSLLSGPTIAHFLAEERLLTPDIANAFIPGEAAAAILCQAGAPAHFALSGIGLTRERAFLYNPEDLPLRADAMTQAYRDAMAAANITDFGHVDYRICDMTGESYFFKQSALAMQRTMRTHRDPQDIWSPTDSVGNIGAAMVPLMIGWGLTAFERGYGPGEVVLIEATGDDGACGAAILQAATRERAAA